MLQKTNITTTKRSKTVSTTMAGKRGSIHSSFPVTPPPSPIPTGKGSRSASSSALSEYIHRSLRVPELTLPQLVRHHQPELISYESIKSRENESVKRLLKSARELGVFGIIDHGIMTEELKLALANSERVFGLMVKHCMTTYGDHEKLIWHDHGQFNILSEEAKAVIGDNNFQTFRHEMDKVSSHLQSICEELLKVIAQGAEYQTTEPVEFGESTMSIYRYHRANIIDRISSSVVEKANQEAGPYAMSLHLLLASGEFCLNINGENSTFGISSDAIVVTLGEELEGLRQLGVKSCEGKLAFKPFLHTSKPSFSMKQKWSISNSKVVSESSKIIRLSDQIVIVLTVTLLYRFFAYFMHTQI